MCKYTHIYVYIQCEWTIFIGYINSLLLELSGSQIFIWNLCFEICQFNWHIQQKYATSIDSSTGSLLVNELGTGHKMGDFGRLATFAFY